MPEYSELLYDVSAGVATITLNRPERLNAITLAMLASLSAALREADLDREVRVVVLTGAGRGFCAGLDLKDTAAGYGLDLALGCDIRIASSEAKLAAVFTRRGILPESGGSWLLPRLIGWARAAEVAFRGMTLSAAEALEMGLVNRVVEPDELLPAANELAAEIAANAPLAVQATKRMMRLGLEETFEANVHHVFLQLLPLFQTEDFREGVRAFLEKRPAEFQGR